MALFQILQSYKELIIVICYNPGRWKKEAESYSIIYYNLWKWKKEAIIPIISKAS